MHELGGNMHNRYHVCATCVNYKIEKKDAIMNYYCGRLGFETNPKYQFQCWTPKEQVRKLMDKRDQFQKGNGPEVC